MAHEKLKPTYEFTENKIKALKQIVPEAFEDGKINFDTLRECLGDLVEDSDDERFGLVWPGKKEARRLAAIPSKGTLVPVYGKGLKADGTPDTDGINDSKNIFIEGENLEVLKILQKSYAGRIKMIYIDPPYNTGNDFVYDDDFTEPLEHYLRRTGQIDDEGKALTTNKKSDGRFHSKWLDMMYPRLKLARELLTEDGVIFISIDDNELFNLKIICDEIFGLENFISCFIWEKRITRENRKVVSTRHDYILCYSKNKRIERALNLLPMNEEAISRYKNPDNDLRGVWTSVPAIAQGGHGTKSQFYTLTTPSGRVLDPPSGSCWRYTSEKMEEAIKDKRIWFGRDGNGVPRIKKFLNEGQQGLTPETMWRAKEVGTNDSAKRELTELFEGIAVFETPKPTKLLERIVGLAINRSEDICLDFFSGSSPLPKAILSRSQTEMTPNYICVQFPQPSNEKSVAKKEGYETISQIAIESIRKSSQNSKIDDKGFKVFKLVKSQLDHIWSGSLDNLFQIQKSMNNSKLLFEIILLEGFSLASNMRQTSNENDYTIVDCDWHNNNLQICLDDKIKDSTIEEIELGDDIFICFDHAITDQGKLRLSDKGLIKTIG